MVKLHKIDHMWSFHDDDNYTQLHVCKREFAPELPEPMGVP